MLAGHAPEWRKSWEQAASCIADVVTAVKNALQTIPAERHILLYSINDDSTLGSWRAITESKREANTLVAGLGGSIAALKELRSNPQWVAEGSVFSTHWGQYLMAMGVAIMGGVSVLRKRMPGEDQAPGWRYRH